jgi:hypothetical protein
LVKELLVNKPANTFDECPVALMPFHMFYVFQRKQKLISVVIRIPTLYFNNVLQVCAKMFLLFMASDNKGAMI